MSNKGITQTINSQRSILIDYVLIGYWRGVQRITTHLKQQKTSWPKMFPLQDQIRVAISVYFWQGKPRNQNRIPSSFFVTVSWSKGHCGLADLLSYINFLNIVLESPSRQCQRTWKEKNYYYFNYAFLPANSKHR